MANQNQSPENVSKGPLATHKERTPAVVEGKRNELGETRNRRLYTPPADILETESEFYVIADMPGVDEHSVSVNLDRNILTINARPDIEVPKGFSLSYREYIPGDYERRFVLADVIDRDHIEASVKNGVLHLHLPKASHAKPRRITVRGG